MRYAGHPKTSTTMMFTKPKSLPRDSLSVSPKPPLGMLAFFGTCVSPSLRWFVLLHASKLSHTQSARISHHSMKGGTIMSAHQRRSFSLEHTIISTLYSPFTSTEKPHSHCLPSLILRPQMYIFASLSFSVPFGGKSQRVCLGKHRHTVP